jgi:hypothetical protein
LAGGIISEFREMGKFPAPALAHRVSKPWLKIAEEQEGLPAAPLLAHEQERDLQ